MHQLAIALHKKGYLITGSDDEIFEPAKSNLLQHNIFPAIIGWNANNITPDLYAVILGMHAKDDNPELIKAKELGLNIYSFPEYIYKESIDKTRIVVGGSHGKTTTTSMIMHVLQECKLKFDYMVGAKLEGFSQSVDITDAPVIICEGDEYPASALEKRPKFHFLFPQVAILTGIAWDHINVFPTYEFYKEQFTIFIGMIEKGGILIYNETDSELDNLVKSCKRDDIKYIPYGVPEHTIIDGITKVTIDRTTVELKVFGNHNLLNLYAAYYACTTQGISAEKFLHSIANFKGASLRLEKIAGNAQTIIYRDFAHAPSKLKATLEAVRNQFPDKIIVALFELHTYSSLSAAFLKEYDGAMKDADKAVVYYSNHALEIKRLKSLSLEEVKQHFNQDDLEVINDRTTLENWLLSLNLQNTVLLFMSSGNYDGIDIKTFANQLTSK